MRVGVPVHTLNNGNPVDTVTIRYKDYYFFIYLDGESGKPTGDFGWSDDPTMNPTVPIRDIWVATPPKKGKK